MKIFYYILFGAILLTAGCREGYELAKTFNVYGYDFTKYTAQGFLFTPESYEGDYESVGLIEMYLYPEVTNEVDENQDAMTRSGYSYWYVGKISAAELIDSLFNVTKEMGADAVVRLTINQTEPISNGVINFRGIKASGFAIKRK